MEKPKSSTYRAMNRKPKDQLVKKMKTLPPDTIRYLMDNRKMTISEIADIIGITTTVISTGLHLNEIRAAYELAAKFHVQTISKPQKDAQSLPETPSLPVAPLPSPRKPESLAEALQPVLDYLRDKTILTITRDELDALNEPLRQLITDMSEKG
jgi:hypothetical protein